MTPVTGLKLKVPALYNNKNFTLVDEKTMVYPEPYRKMHLSHRADNETGLEYVVVSVDHQPGEGEPIFFYVAESEFFTDVKDQNHLAREFMKSCIERDFCLTTAHGLAEFVRISRMSGDAFLIAFNLVNMDVIGTYQDKKPEMPDGFIKSAIGDIIRPEKLALETDVNFDDLMKDIRSRFAQTSVIKMEAVAPVIQSETVVATDGKYFSFFTVTLVQCKNRHRLTFMIGGKETYLPAERVSMASGKTDISEMMQWFDQTLKAGGIDKVIKRMNAEAVKQIKMNGEI